MGVEGEDGIGGASCSWPPKPPSDCKPSSPKVGMAVAGIGFTGDIGKPGMGGMVSKAAGDGVERDGRDAPPSRAAAAPRARAGREGCFHALWDRIHASQQRETWVMKSA